MSSKILIEEKKEGSITFLLTDITLDGDLSINAIIDEGIKEASLSADVILHTTISLDKVKEIFLFKTDSNSINDIIEDDLYFKQRLLFNNYLLDSIKNSRCIIKNNFYNIGEEYILFLSKQIFGTELAVDLFDNTKIIKNDIVNVFENAFNNYFINNHNESYNLNYFTVDHLSNKIFQTIMRNDGNRLTLNGIENGSLSQIIATDNFQPLPLAKNDILVMKYTLIDKNVHVPELVNNTYDSIRHNNKREYLIRMVITEEEITDINNFFEHFLILETE